MKTLEVLLKRANRDMEALSGEANKALAKKNDVLARRAACEAKAIAEAAMFDGSALSGLGFAAFQDLQKARLKELDAELEQAEAEHDVCKAALTKAFAEVKKLENLLRMQNQREMAERMTREQNSQDERSSQMYGRR